MRIPSGSILQHTELQQVSTYTPEIATVPINMPCAHPLQETGQFETMLDVVNVLLELGGDLSRVNVVGNDFVAVAGR